MLYIMLELCLVLHGQNVLFCMRRYNCSLRDLLTKSVNNIIMPFALKSVDEDMYCTANFLLELIMIQNNSLCIGRSVQTQSFTYDEVQSMIEYVSTC